MISPTLAPKNVSRETFWLRSCFKKRTSGIMRENKILFWAERARKIIAHQLSRCIKVFALFLRFV
jgi:hypothetical protein